MTIIEEIEEVAEGMAEAPDHKKFQAKKFSSGHDWSHMDGIKERAKFIRCAIAVCVGAKYTLTAEPHNFREVVVGGKVVTTKGDGWYL